MIDLDDISNCPLGEECSVCESQEDLFIATAGTQVGVYCTTLCPLCAWRSNSVPVVTAVQRVLEHCGHLGIDADQMAAAMEQEAAWPGSR